MNRLLLRSYGNSSYPTRVEIQFMNVKFISIATSLYGLSVAHLGTYVDALEPFCLRWTTAPMLRTNWKHRTVSDMLSLARRPGLSRPRGRMSPVNSS